MEFSRNRKIYWFHDRKISRLDFFEKKEPPVPPVSFSFGILERPRGSHGGTMWHPMAQDTIVSDDGFEELSPAVVASSLSTGLEAQRIRPAERVCRVGEEAD